MTNLNMLETLRTKEELVNYFKGIDQNITEEEIDKLKKSYEQAEENKDTLSLKELDKVAGGILFEIKIKNYNPLCLPPLRSEDIEVTDVKLDGNSQ